MPRDVHTQFKVADASIEALGVARSTCLQCCSAAVRLRHAVIVPSQLVVEVIGVTQMPTIRRPHA